MAPTAFIGHKRSKNCLKQFDSGVNPITTLNDAVNSFREGDYVYIENESISAVLIFKKPLLVKNYLAFEYFYIVTWQNIIKRDSWIFVEKSRLAKPEEINLLKTKFKINQ